MDMTGVSVIVKLSIPRDAWRRVGHHEAKRRCSKALVLAVYEMYGDKRRLRLLPKHTIATNYHSHQPYTEYKAGKWVKPRYAFSKKDKTCASGIHYYATARGAKGHY